MSRRRADDEATRVDASILEKQRERKAEESFDEPTALMRRGEPGSLPTDVTIRNRPAVPDLADEPSEGTVVVRGTVAGRLERGDEAPPLPFKASSSSAPPPPAVDLYEGALDPLGVTGKLKQHRSAPLPFDEDADAAAPPLAADDLGDPGPVMTETSTMLHKVNADALPFDGPQPKYPPKQLVPLEQNPLYAGGMASVTATESTGGGSRGLVIAALVIIAVIVAAVLVMRSTGT